MTPYRNLYRLLFLLLLTVWSQCYPRNLNCGTAGSATSAGGHGIIGSTSDTTLTVSETSGGSAISRSEYIPGETLYVDMSTSQQYLIEMTNNGATFNSGGSSSCSYRKNNGGGAVTMPGAGSGTVTFYGIVATGGSSSSEVKRVPKVELAEGAPAPTADPTPSPTPRPTVEGETNPPSPRPTLAPTTRAPVVGPYVDGYTVQIKFDLTVDKTYEQLIDAGIVSKLSSLLATALGVSTERIIIQSILPSPNRRRRLLEYVFLSNQQFSVTVGVLDVSTVSDGTTITNAANPYISGSTFRNDLGTNLGMTVSSVSAISISTVLAEADTEHTCQLNSHMSLSWRNYEADKTVKIALLSDSATNWIAAGVTHKLNAMVATSGPANGVFIYAPNKNWAGYHYMNGYSASDIVMDTQNRVGTEILLIQSNPDTSSTGSSSLVFNYTGATRSGVAEDPEIDFDNGNYVMWAHGGNWPASHAHNAKGSIKVNWAQGNCDEVKSADNIYFMLLIHLVPVALVAIYLSGFLSIKEVKRTLSTKPTIANISWMQWLTDGSLTIGVSLSVAVYIVAAILIGVVYNPRLGQLRNDRKFNIITGDLAMMNMWLAMLPSSRTSVLTKLHGIPFERTVRYHKMFTTSAMVLGILHAISSAKIHGDKIYTLDIMGENEVVPLYGLLAISLFGIMVLTAIEIVRRAHYELFFIVHQLYIPAVIFLCLHVKDVYIGFMPGVLLKLIDEVTRVVAMYRAEVADACSVEGNITLIQCNLPRSQQQRISYNYENVAESELVVVDPKVLPVTSSREENSIKPSSFAIEHDQLGQWYFLTVPDISYLESHPVSVADIDYSSNTVSFYIKNVGEGTWSGQLHQLVANQRKSGKKHLAVSLEGPYGNLSIDINNYRAVTLIAGGIGITPLLPILKYMKDRDKYSSSQLRVHLIWSVRDPVIINTFKNILAKVLSRNDVGTYQLTRHGDGLSNDVLFLADIYCTSASNDDGKDLESMGGNFQCTMHRGRPDVYSIISNNSDYDDSIGVVDQCVIMCGPQGLLQEASHACIDKGIDYHSEVFNW